ncbi:class III lanthipeptide [Bacillus toyonensis]|nr:class III lanthipeptide [Bacillus toyonensis]
MKDVLALQKMNKTKQKDKGQNPAKSSISLGCSPSSNTSWFFC